MRLDVFSVFLKVCSTERIAQRGGRRQKAKCELTSSSSSSLLTLPFFDLLYPHRWSLSRFELHLRLLVQEVGTQLENRNSICRRNFERCFWWDSRVWSEAYKWESSWPFGRMEVSRMRVREAVERGYREVTSVTSEMTLSFT